MSHQVEIVDGQAQIAYAGETPWHNLGTEVPDDLTPAQIMKAANLDWKVYTEPCYSEIAGKKVPIGKQALIRDRDNKVLDIISDDWKPLQNEDAFSFFNDFVAAGEMKMDVAGSLRGGKLVWGLAKTNESFELFGGRDQIESYLLFTNPHSYGQSIDVRMTAVRCVCNNTITLALNTQSKKMVRVNHRSTFDPELVKETLGVTAEKMAHYKEISEHLSSKRFTNESMVDYFKRVFPLGETSEKEMSRNAKIAMSVVEAQPGAELGEGSMWALFNAVTFTTNHILGRTDDTRLQSTWYGSNKNINDRALQIALDMAA